MSYTPDEQVKQDYIQNKLSPDAKLKFETWLFDHPDEQEELELDLILKSGVKQYYQEETVKKVSKVGWLPAFGMAAAFVLMTWGLLMPMLNGEGAEGLVAPDVSIFSQLRSAEQTVWQLDGASDQLIQIPVAYLSNDTYQVNISGGSDMQISGLTPNLDMVSLMVSKGTLNAGDYQLELVNLVNNEKQQFAFQVK